MAEGDFDIHSLASYLHLLPQQVLRLTDRGKLPGRKVGGAWRFSRAEIHHWLEQRMGILDDEQLAHIEDVFERHAAPEEEAPSIEHLLTPEAIAVPLAAKTRESVIKSMVQLAAATGLVWDPEKLADAVRTREQMQPTALENGVALLHPRRPMPSILGGPVLALGHTTQGIPFGGAGGVLTDIFFLICSMDDQEHLRSLARLARLVSDPELLRNIRSAEDAAAVHALIGERERQLTS